MTPKTHCPQDHPYDDVNTYVDRRGRRYCRTCQRAQTRRWAARNRELIRETQKAYRQKPEVQERRREYEKSPRERARRAERKQILRATDPAWAERARSRARARMAAQTTEQRIARLAYHARRRAAEYAAIGAELLTDAAAIARVAVFGFRCAYCGSAFEQLDHRIPLARGGSSLPANIVPSCRECNRRKNWRTPREWTRHLERQAA